MEATFCLENLVLSELSLICEISTCLHKFHWDCIIPWQESISLTDGEMSCPLCLGRSLSDNEMITKDLASRLRARKHHNELRVSCQKKHATKLRHQRMNKCDVSPGDIISIKVPIQDRSPRSNLNVIGIVVKVGSTHGLGVIALTETGILAKNLTDAANQRDLFLPSDWYWKCNQELPISDTLARYQKQIREHVFVDVAISRISIRKAHEHAYGKSQKEEVVKCRCKRGVCTGNCKCTKNNRKCTTLCSCKGEGDCFRISPIIKELGQCRCANNNCGNRCGCLKSKRSCHQGCGCKGQCVQSNTV